jgi:hypothetical protein
MHTYRRAKDGTWEVILYDHVSRSYEVVKPFKYEIQAVGFVNFLNGGSQDITLIKELIEQ